MCGYRLLKSDSNIRYAYKQNSEYAGLTFIQDKHHFVSAWYANEPLEAYPPNGNGVFFLKNSRYQKRDALKQQAMRELGRTLIIVPCWWDGSKERYSCLFAKKAAAVIVDFCHLCLSIHNCGYMIVD